MPYKTTLITTRSRIQAKPTWEQTINHASPTKSTDIELFHVSVPFDVCLSVCFSRPGGTGFYYFWGQSRDVPSPQKTNKSPGWIRWKFGGLSQKLSILLTFDFLCIYSAGWVTSVILFVTPYLSRRTFSCPAASCWSPANQEKSTFYLPVGEKDRKMIKIPSPFFSCLLHSAERSLCSQSTN